MGDLGNLIDFAYSWIRNKNWRKYLFLYIAVVVCAIAIPIAILLTVFSSPTQPLTGVSMLSSMVLGIFALFALIAAVVCFGWIGFVIVGKALESKGYAAKITKFNFDSFFAFLGVAVISFITSFFNWLSIPILVIELLSYVLMAIGLLIGFWVAIGFLAIPIVFAVYTSIRLALAAPIRIVEKNGAIESIKGSWEKTKGELWEVVGLTSAASLPVSFVIFNVEPALRLIVIGFDTPSMGLNAFSTVNLTIVILIYPILIIAGVAAGGLSGALGLAYAYHIIKQTEKGKYKNLEI